MRPETHTRICRICGAEFTASIYSRKDLPCQSCQPRRSLLDAAYQREHRRKRAAAAAAASPLPKTINPRATVILGRLAAGAIDPDGYGRAMIGNVFLYYDFQDVPKDFLPEGITFYISTYGQKIASGQVINGLPRIIGEIKSVV